ncbi:MAG: hypothetical protein IT384_21520 [Deltaproteobacteria bacterium]|nr:hypothetical protein [Deltaproteobacteria bacterium]
MKVLALFAGSFVVGLSLSLLPFQAPPDARAGDCCRLIVTGCGKEAKVCVAQSCGSDAEKKARSAFEKKMSCNSSNVSSYIGTCSGEKCEIDLR